MVFGLFGGNDEDIALKSSLSKEMFLSEFEKTQGVFGIDRQYKGGKTDTYTKVEATAKFLFEFTMVRAVSAKTINTKREIEAAAILGVAIIHCLGRNAGMSKTQLQFLQGIVLGYVLAKTLPTEQNKLSGKAITKAIIKYAHKIRQKKFRQNVEAVENNVTLFLTERDPKYYADLAGDIGRFI